MPAISVIASGVMRPCSCWTAQSAGRMALRARGYRSRARSMAVRVAACNVIRGIPRACWSSVDVPEHDVDGADHRDDVGDQLATNHVGQGAEVAEGWRPYLAPVGPVGAVAHQVEAQLAPRGLDCLVDLPRWDAHPLGDQLEVVDERLHAGVELVPRRERD